MLTAAVLAYAIVTLRHAAIVTMRCLRYSRCFAITLPPRVAVIAAALFTP